MTAAPADLWLHSRRYDLFWYAVVPLILLVALTALSAAVGPKGPLIAYVVSAMLTGLPHNMVTWLLLMPRESRGYYRSGVVFGPFVWTAIFMLPAVLFFDTPAFAWALTINIVLAYYHITRQHMGMIHACDARYAAVTGDVSVRAWSGDLRLAIAGVAASALAWKATGGPMLLGMYGISMQFMLTPVPVALPVALTAATAFVTIRAAIAGWRRHRAGRAFPTAHAALALPAMANLLVASLVPNDQFYLTLALVASYHNMQYFAFCYTHHQLRAAADTRTGDFYSRWARARAWAPWFAVPVVLGVAFGAITAVIPPFWGAMLAMGFMTSHYFVDGLMWRRKYYPAMGRFASGSVAAEAKPSRMEASCSSAT